MRYKKDRLKFHLMYTKLAFCVVFCSQIIQGQIDTTYYKKIIEITKDNQLKLQSLDSIIKYFSKNKKSKQTSQYQLLYIELALDMGENEKAAKRLIRYPKISSLDTKKKRKYYYSLIERYEKATRSLKKDSPSWEVAYMKGLYHSFLYNSKESIQYYDIVIEKIDKGTREYRIALMNRGLSKSYLGDIVGAFEDLKKVGKLYLEVGAKTKYLGTLSMISDMYEDIGLIDEAIEEKLKVISLMQGGQDYGNLSYEYALLAQSYSRLNDNTREEEALKKGIDIIKNVESASDREYLQAVFYLSFVRLYAGKDQKKAANYLNKLYKLGKNPSENPSIDVDYKMAKAKYLFYNNEIEKSLQLYLECLKISEEREEIHEMMEINKDLSKVYEFKKEYKKALFHDRKHTQLKDSILNLQKSNTLSYYESLYESERKGSEILKQQEEIRTLEDEAKAKKLTMIVGGIGLTLLFVILFLLRNQKFLKRKNELKAKFSQHLLLSRDNERKRISKDLHDSLGQKLLLIKHKVSRDDTEIKNLLNDSIEEMRSISRRLNPMQLKEERITSIISNLIEELDMAYPEIYIFAEIDDINDLLSTQQELNLYRIIQESFSNIIKHAKASSAKLEIMRQNKSILVTIQDNGVGFEFSKKFNSSKSMGLKTIEERVRFLRGQLNVISNRGKGTVITIVI